MKLPRFINYIWASDPDPNSINVVPDVPNPNDVAAKPSLASYTKGFRLVSMMPEMAGGKPAYGQDVNGVLHDVTEIAQYSQAGNYYPYDATFQKSIGGYNKYAVVLNPADGKLYQSLVDSNLAPLSDTNSWGFFTDGKFMPITATFFYLGEIRLFPFRSNELPQGWVEADGLTYPISSKIGAALNSLSDGYKEDWNIVIKDEMINVPNVYDLDTGEGYFFRPCRRGRKVGSIQEDAIRNMWGTFYSLYRNGGRNPPRGAFAYTGRKASADVGQGDSDNWMNEVRFDLENGTYPLANEIRPKNIGMLPAIYLGV